jgi:carbonic anhydrase/acetyltransferase-like protein (isoleucine patch superfamily)
LADFSAKKPALGKNVFIAKNATVIGDFTLAPAARSTHLKINIVRARREENLQPV